MTPQILATRLQNSLIPFLASLLKPQNLAGVARRMPAKLNYAIIGKMLNLAFAEQIEARDFEFLTGRTLQIEISDAELFVGISYFQNRLICTHMQGSPCQADVSLTINTLNAIQLIQQQVDPDTLFFQRKLKIRGDTELAHHVKNTIDTLNPEVIPKFIMQLLSKYKNLIVD